MRLAALWLSVGLIAGAAPCFAASDIKAGEAKAAEACAGCHGDKGVSEIPSVPSLAGQTDNFLQWQLVFFRSGRRTNEIMGPLSAELTDEDVRNLGGYYASLQPATTSIANEAPASLAAEGQKIAAEHHCSACHQDNFTGKAAAARLLHQHEDYLAKALTDYRAASRPSVGVAAMTEAASGLSDQDIAALAHYLATLP
jgi:cytochrome c553